MAFVKSLYGLRNTISVLTLMSSLGGSPVWAMEEPEESSSLVPSCASSIPRSYPPTMVRDIPSTYSDDVEREEWGLVVQRLKQVAMKSSLDPDLFPTTWEKYETELDSFFSLYQRLHKNYNKTVKTLTTKKLLLPLFRGVACFESLYGSKSALIHLADLEACVPTFQKIWTPYMKAYEAITGEVLGFFGPLNYAAEHEKFYKHLYYTRDSQGLLLFTIFPHEQIEGSLYQTYVPYGDRNNEWFLQRTILFRKTSDKTIQLEASSGLLIHESSDKALSVIPYIGSEGKVPYVTQKGILFREKWFHSHPELALREMLYEAIEESPEETHHSFIKETLPQEFHTDTRTTIAEIPCFDEAEKPLQKMQKLLEEVLNGTPRKFIIRPSSDTQHREAEFVFLLNTQEKFQETPEDEDIRLLTDSIRENYEAESLEEIIAGYEESLIDTYTQEEETKIREEQEARQEMVRNHEYDKLKGKKAKKNKKRQIHKTYPSTSRKGPEKLNEEGIKEKAKTAAKKRIELLKKKEIRKHLKYNEYLNIINIATQELRQQGISVSGALNASSHGSLAIGNQTVPIYRPHGQHDTVHIKSARRMLDNLLNAYFSTISSSSEANHDKM